MFAQVVAKLQKQKSTCSFKSVVHKVGGTALLGAVKQKQAVVGR